MVVAALLGFMAVTGLFGWLNLQGLELTIRLAEEIYCDQETSVTLVIAKRGRLASFLLRVGMGTATVRLPVIMPGEEQLLSMVFRFPCRGITTTGRCWVNSPFPVGFFVRSWELGDGKKLTVFPALRSCPMPVAPVGNRPQPEGTPAGYGHDGDVARIADYTGSESLRLVHWRLSARQGSLKVRHLTSGAMEPVVIDVSSLPGGNVEERLGCAAYLVNRLSLAGRPTGLLLGGRLIPPALQRGHRFRLLTELALHATD